jgi:hypothetical protein
MKIGNLSITGAHNTLIEYVIPTQLKNPIVARLTSASLNHADSVENTSRKGNPAENPRKVIVITLGSR